MRGIVAAAFDCTQLPGLLLDIARIALVCLSVQRLARSLHSHKDFVLSDFVETMY